MLFALFLINLTVGSLAQYYGYGYPYPYNYGGGFQGYPPTNQGFPPTNQGFPPTNQGFPPTNQGFTYPWYQQPCRSSCGNPKPSPCGGQQTPCGQRQPIYYQQQPSFSFGNPYANWYPDSRRPDPYANVPVEIIDDPSVNQNVPTKQQDRYANVPVEIIDDESVGSYWNKVPFLPKTTRSSSNYTVNYGPITSSSITESKPIQATIGRSFQPAPQVAESFHRLDFLNGVPVNPQTNTNERSTTESSTQQVATQKATTEKVETATSDEKVAPVFSWF